MSEMLKGNYRVEKQVEVQADNKERDASIEALFESSAMEKLGGSMAFVKKSGTFLWKDEKAK